MTIRHRFSAFIESLQQPRRKFGAVCFLLAFVCFDFLLGGIYFLAGFFALKNIGPAAEMAAEIADLYQISVYVDTSQYLWWCIPFFTLAVITGVILGNYIYRYRRAQTRKNRRHALRAKERIRAKEDAVVAVHVHTVDPNKAKREDLRNAPPAWLLDPLAVIHENTDNRQTPPETEQPQEESVRRPYTYSDYMQRPHSVSTPHNTVQRPRTKQADIPYAGSLQYVPRTEKKKNKDRSPYDPYST
ncbi:MAG: hypothetical protein IJC45_10035 [Clostridia bacterium]|nr:hypothetical protein [Clostridia bacterium]